MSKFTPRPWIDRPDPSSNQGDHPHGDYVIGVGDAIDSIAVVGGKANARLIAASPELFSELTDFHAHTIDMGWHTCDGVGHCPVADVLAKATGEQP